jgi:hypothetical protein
MDMLGSSLREKQQQSNVKYVTRLAKQRRENTIHNLGKTEMETQQFILDQRWTQTDLKTTKFIPSKPVIEFEGEPPF